MPNFNSTASQILNGTANFLNGVANAARDVVANPIADIANIGLKTNPYVAAANLVTKGKVNKAIDTVTSAAKGEQPNSLQKQPEDPTSLAYAAGEGLTRGVDQAAAVISLAEAARQLPKAAQKGWAKILNKVKDAKSKKQQMKLAKEAREYINNSIEKYGSSVQDSTAPAYQQRAMANAINNNRKDSSVAIKAAYPMETYANSLDRNNGFITNLNPTEQLEQMGKQKFQGAQNINMDPRSFVAEEGTPRYFVQSADFPSGNKTLAGNPILRNGVKTPLPAEDAARVGVPYKGRNMQNIKAVQKEVQDLVKMSDKDFKKLMQDKAAASTAGYGDWRYNLGDDWIENWNNPKEYQRMKEEIADNILNDAGLNYGVSEAYGDAIKSNAAKSSKRYRNWLKKEAKNTYEKNTQPITRAERNAADMNAAEVEKKRIMDQYGISSKDYDEYADAAANTYIYIDKNGNPVNKMAGAGWPGGGDYFIDESKEVMPYLRGYARRHPTVDEYIRMAEEEAELSRLASEEADDIAREAGPAYDSDRYLNWSL